jgi:hypothetical protein
MEPFKRGKDKVALVGFSTRTRSLAPFDDPDFEIWGLNEEYNWFPKKVEGVLTMESWLKRYERWFQMHPVNDYMRANNTNDRNHPMWLLNVSGKCMACNGTKEWENYMNAGKKEKCPFCQDGVYHPPEARKDLIIYMQEAHPEIPGSVKYPLNEIVSNMMPEGMRKTGRGNYFRSSPAFMLALAISMRYKTIGVYGFEMGTDTEYHYQRANFEYWVGRAHSLGIEVILPNESSLLRGELYGYETLKVGYRQDLEMRKTFLEMRVKLAQEFAKIKEGAHEALNALLKSGKFSEEDLKAAVKAAKIEHSKAQAMSNFKRGAQQEVELQLKMFDAYYNAETRETVVKAEELINTDYTFDAPKKEEE